MAINRYYSSTAIDTTLVYGISASDTQIVLATIAGYPTSYPFTLSLGYDTSSEEIVDVTSVGSATNSYIISRGVDSTTAITHSAGSTVKHVITGRDMREAQAHIAGTTSVHGIADTSTLVTTGATQTITGKTINSSNNTLTVAQASVTNLTTDLAAKASTTDLALKAPLASPTFTGTVTLPTGTVTSATLATGAVTSTALAAGSVTSAAIGTGTVTSTNIADGTIVNADIAAAAAVDWTKLGISSTVSSTQIGYVAGVTSAIQTQLNSKAGTAGPTFTGTVTLPSTTSVGAVTSTELGYVDGVTSPIQTQIDTKSPTASPTFTGTVTLPTVTPTTQIPYAMEVNTASITGSGSVTFTAGRFAVAPIVTLAIQSTSGPTGTSATYSSPTTTGMNLYVWTGATASASARSVSFVAVQMTSTTAAG
jgi:hypothetical protein